MGTNGNRSSPNPSVNSSSSSKRRARRRIIPSESPSVASKLNLGQRLRHVSQTRGKKVKFYCNGSPYAEDSIELCINPDRYRSIDPLYEELNRLLSDREGLSNGVRFILDLDSGKPITDVLQLMDKSSFVCSSTEQLKRIRYSSIRTKPTWNNATYLGNELNSRTVSLLNNSSKSTTVSKRQNQENSYRKKTLITPRRITIFLHGPRPRIYRRVLISEKVARSFTQFLDELTKVLGPLTAPVQKVISASTLKECTSLLDFLGDYDGYIAVTSEKRNSYSQEELKLDQEEIRVVSQNRPFKYQVVVEAQKRFGEASPLKEFNGRTSQNRNVNLKAKDAKLNANQNDSLHKQVLQNKNQHGKVNVRPQSCRPESLRQHNESGSVPSTPQSHRRGGNSSSIKPYQRHASSPRQQRPSTTTPKSKTWKARNLSYPAPIRRRYYVEDCIGTGNFANVYFARCIKSDSGYAIKVIDKRKVENSLNLENEINLLKKLKHDNIVNLKEQHSFVNSVYLIMEYVAGGDLFQHVSEKSKLDEIESATLMSSLVDGLQYLHANRICHRDVKPENLLLASRGEHRYLKLCDFGLATEIVLGKKLFTICGSPTYVAPEILKECGYSFKVDVWAAGVILYIMLSGYSPFPAESSHEKLFSHIIRGKYAFDEEFWTDVSVEAKYLISKILVVDEHDRLDNEEILHDPWIRSQMRGNNINKSNHPLPTHAEAITLHETTTNGRDAQSSIDFDGLLSLEEVEHHISETAARVSNVEQLILLNGEIDINNRPQGNFDCTEESSNLHYPHDESTSYDAPNVRPLSCADGVYDNLHPR